MTAAKSAIREVAPLKFSSEAVVKELEELLEKAKTGEIRAIAAVYEYRDGTGGWTSAFGSWVHRVAMVGRLHVLAQHITQATIIGDD